MSVSTTSPDRHAIEQSPGDDRPVLVTGTHRSGSTWVGMVLTLSGEAGELVEPFNPLNWRSWFAPRPEIWFEHVDEENAGRRAADIRRMLAFAPPYGALLRRCTTHKHFILLGQDARAAWRWRRERRRLVLKDPLALFAAPWLEREFGMRILLLVRHPAAFVGSVKRLGWRFDFSNLTRQPRLMETWLAEFASEIHAASKQELPIVDEACLLWRLLNGAALELAASRPDWVVTRYEDLAAEPESAFPQLYERLGLTWTAAAQARLRDFVAIDHQPDAPRQPKTSIRRDSRAAMQTWRTRLSEEEIAHVRGSTDDVAQSVYGDSMWWEAQ